MEGVYSRAIILLRRRALIISPLIVEDNDLSRELFQNGDCGIAYSAIAILVKFPVSASRESLLQHGWERTQHMWPPALRMAVCELMNPIMLLLCLPLSKKERSLLTPLSPGFFSALLNIIHSPISAQVRSVSPPLSHFLPTEKLTCFINTSLLSQPCGSCPSGCNPLLF